MPCEPIQKTEAARLTRAQEIAEAITGTLSTTGAALVVSALTTGIGFAVLLLSSLIPFQQFGALLIVAVMGSALVSVLVLPSMLVLWERWIVTRRAKSTAPMPVQVGGSGS